MTKILWWNFEVSIIYQSKWKANIKMNTSLLAFTIYTMLVSVRFLDFCYCYTRFKVFWNSFLFYILVIIFSYYYYLFWLFLHETVFTNFLDFWMTCESLSLQIFYFLNCPKLFLVVYIYIYIYIYIYTFF